jgi:hypothetical protein
MIHRLLAAAVLGGSIGLAVACPSIAAADPACPQNNKVILQGEELPMPAQGHVVCDDDPGGGDGLLGDAPVVGRLPGLSGVL